MSLTPANIFGSSKSCFSSQSELPLVPEGCLPSADIKSVLLELSEKFKNDSQNVAAHLILTMSGPHGTDIMAALLTCLTNGPPDLRLCDTSFSRIHHNVTFAALLYIPKFEEFDIKAWAFQIVECSKKWHSVALAAVLNIINSSPPPLSQAPYANRSIHAVTLLGPGNGISPRLLQTFTNLLLEYRVSVLRMTRLDSDQGTMAMRAAEFSLSVPVDTNIGEFRDRLFQTVISCGADAALQADNIFRRSKRLVVFDMDSTLVEEEAIDELAALAGQTVQEKVAQVTLRAMRGELDFAESLKSRVALLKGLAAAPSFAKVKGSLTLRKGARRLCRCLKVLGFKLAVISGGFTPLADYVRAELDLDYSFANTLTVDANGLLTGETTGPIITGERKAELLEVIAQGEKILLEQVVAIGDGANDLPMISRAGLGIAFNAKPHVQERAPNRVNQQDMSSILYLLGYSDHDICNLLQRIGDSQA